MFSQTTKFFRRRISSQMFDARLGQAVCFVAGIVLVCVSFWKLTRLAMTETEFFLGVLLSLCVPLLLFNIGLILPIAVRGRKEDSQATEP